MASFGERLKREREKRKVSLDEIALSTKIGTRMLHALEEEKFEQLPGGIFNKGFVRAYARHLGLDEEQTIADYLEAAGETAPTRLEVTSEVRILPARETDSEKPTRTVPWGMLAAGLLILALVLSVWSYFRREQREASAPEPVRAAAPSSNDNGQGAGTSCLQCKTLRHSILRQPSLTKSRSTQTRRPPQEPLPLRSRPTTIHGWQSLPMAKQWPQIVALRRNN